jgi:hypothetical protein
MQFAVSEVYASVISSMPAHCAAVLLQATVANIFIGYSA